MVCSLVPFAAVAEEVLARPDHALPLASSIVEVKLTGGFGWGRLSKVAGRLSERASVRGRGWACANRSRWQSMRLRWSMPLGFLWRGQDHGRVAEEERLDAEDAHEELVGEVNVYSVVVNEELGFGGPDVGVVAVVPFELLFAESVGTEVVEADAVTGHFDDLEHEVVVLLDHEVSAEHVVEPAVQDGKVEARAVEGDEWTGERFDLVGERREAFDLRCVHGVEIIAAETCY